MTLEKKIQILVEKNVFRGLWINAELQKDSDEIINTWNVTFIYKGEYVESPHYNNPHKCLDFVFNRLEITE